MADAFAMRALVSADLSAFQREMARGPQIARAFSQGVSREAARALSSTPPVNVGAFSAAGTQAGRGFATGIEREVAQSRPFDGLAAEARKLAKQLGAIWGAREVIRAADEFTNLHNKLRQVAGSAEGAASTYRQLVGVAMDTRTDLGATVDLYTKLGLATRGLGTSQTELRTITTAISQSFAVSGASAESAAGAIRQLGQSLEKGSLNGDELVSLRENAPRLLEAIREMAGATPAEFAKMAEAGEITTELMVRAFQSLAPKIKPQFDALAITISQGSTQMRTAFTDFVGGASDSSGASLALAGTLSTAARNFDTLATAALAAGVVMGARALGNAGTQILNNTRQQVAAYTAVQQATVKTSFAEQAGALAAMEASATQTRAAETRIANIKRVDAALDAQAGRERARLAAAVLEQQRLQAVTARQVAPLGGAVAARVARERAAADQIVAASSTNLLRIDGQRERLTTRLATETAALTGAERASALATTAASGASVRHAAALNAQSVAARGMAAAGRLVGGAYAMLGGPIGVGIIALTGLVLWFQRQKQATEQAKAALDEYRASLLGLKQEELVLRIREENPELTRLNAQADELRAKLAAMPVGVQVGAAAGQFGGVDLGRAKLERDLAALDAKLGTQRAKVQGLAEAYDNLFSGQAKGFQTPAQIADEDVERLARLRIEGLANEGVQKRINDLVKEYRAEIASLRGQTLDTRGQDRLLLLQERVNALTKKVPPTVDVGIKLRADALRKLQTDASDAAQRLDFSLNVDLVVPDTGAYGAALDSLIVKQAALAAEIAKQGGMLKADVATVNAYADAAERVRAAFTFDLPKVAAQFIKTEIVLPIPVDVQKAAARIAKEYQAALDAADAFSFVGNAQGAADATDDARMALERFAAVTQGLSATELSALMKKVGLDSRGAGKDVDKLGDNLRALTMTARGIGQIGEAFGGISDSARDAIDGVTGLLDGISQIQSASKAATKDGGSLFSSFSNFATGIPGMVAAIGGVASLVGGLFGKSAAKKENEEMLRRNNEALADLRNALDRSTQSLGGRAEIGKDVAQALRGGLFERANVLRTMSGGGKNQNTGVDFIDAELRKLGTTFAQVQAVAKDLGLTLVDSKGWLNLEAVRQFTDGLGLSAAALTKFSDSFSDQRSVQDLINDVFDVDLSGRDGAILKFNQQVGFLARTGEDLKQFAPEIAKSFRNIDVSSMEGRAAAEAALREWALAVQAGAITAEQLGGFESIEEFASWITSADSALDEFAETAREAAGQMVNVVSGFKLNQRVFEATLASVPQALTVRPPAVPATPPPGHTPTPYTPPGAAKPMVQQVHNHYHFAEGAIPIDARELPAGELLAKVTREARALASAMSGDRTPAYEAIR